MSSIILNKTKEHFSSSFLSPSSMEFQRNLLATALTLWLFFFSFKPTPIASDPLPFPDAISGLKETVAQALRTGDGEEWEITRFDPTDASVIQSLVYEFHIQIGNTMFPIRLLEDLNNSSNLFGTHDVVQKSRPFSPVLSPFQIAGPLELWIQDGDDLRLSLPVSFSTLYFVTNVSLPPLLAILQNDVDAGVLRKVVLTDGATVTVKGARSVSLRRPIELPLPLNHTNPHGFRHPMASSLSALSEAIREDSRTANSKKQQPVVSLSIRGPTSMTSSSSSSSSTNNNPRLKLKRLAPGLVELSSLALPAPPPPELEESNPPKKTWWPFTYINVSDPNLMGIEALLGSVLGEKANKVGSFRVVKAEVSAKTYVKQRFRMVKRLTDEDVDRMGLPEWKTRPEKFTGYFEVVGRVENNGEVLAEKIVQVQEEPFVLEETSFHPSLLTGNLSRNDDPIIFNPPLSFFSL